jgi:hypothetical protein
MDDEHDNGGFGNFAWYQMGRWSAEMDQEHQRTFDHVRGTGPISRADYNYAVQMNQALAAEDRRLNGLVDHLQGQLNASRADYERLREWANGQATEAAALRTKCAALEALGKEKDALISDIWNRWSDLRWNRDPSSEDDF